LNRRGLDACDAIRYEVYSSAAHIADNETVTDGKLRTLNSSLPRLDGVYSGRFGLRRRNGTLQPRQLSGIETGLLHGLKSPVLGGVRPYCGNCDNQSDWQHPPQLGSILTVKVLDQFSLNSSEEIRDDINGSLLSVDG
jgi:hypothetical protein